MAVKYTTGINTAKWGIPTTGLGGATITTTGISIESISEAFDDPKEFLMNAQNRKIGFAIGIDEEHSLTISGEILGTVGTTGILASAFATHIANTAAEASLGATLIEGSDGPFGMLDDGDFYIESPTLERSRGAWAKFSATFKRWPSITGSAS